MALGERRKNREASWTASPRGQSSTRGGNDAADGVGLSPACGHDLWTVVPRTPGCRRHCRRGCRQHEALSWQCCGSGLLIPPPKCARHDRAKGEALYGLPGRGHARGRGRSRPLNWPSCGRVGCGGCGPTRRPPDVGVGRGLRTERLQTEPAEGVRKRRLEAERSLPTSPSEVKKRSILTFLALLPFSPCQNVCQTTG